MAGSVRQLKHTRALERERWHNTLIAGGRKDGKALSARTVGHAHRLLGKALQEAVKHCLIVKNAASLEKPPKVDEEEVQIIAADRLGELLDRVAGHRLYPYVVLALFCGLRRAEVVALRWAHVDLEHKILKVREAIEETDAYGKRVKAPKSKAGKRDLVMPDIVVEALRKHRQAQLEQRLKLGMGKPADSDLLFPGDLEGGLLSLQWLGNSWGAFAKMIGMPDIKFHALRHTHASQLIAAGVDVVTVSKRLGHAKPTTTLNIYAHLYQQKDDRAAAAVNEALAKIGR
jgi:integrase